MDQARNLVSLAAQDANYPLLDFDVSEPPRKEFGDLTCNIAFQLSKYAKKPPAKIAIELIGHIKSHILQDSFILSAEPHPAGYINFKANYAKLSTATLSKVLLEPDKYGYYDSGKGQHVVIEHTSVNPNKALHVGHIRNVVLGDTLYRIMKATNHRTTVLNYVDDSGLQVADIIVGFKFAGMPIEPANSNRKFDQYCGDEIYVRINEMYEKDPALAEKRKLVLREIEEGNSEIAKFASKITSRVLHEQLKTCWRMKVRYDLLNFESQIILSKLWSKTFELLKKDNIVKFETEGKNKGCWIIEANGEEDKVIVRSDGTATYIAKDIPYAAWKLGLVDDPFSYREFVKQWDGSTLYSTELVDGGKLHTNEKFNCGRIIITIIDSRQARLQRIVSDVLLQIGVGDKQYFHLGYEAVTLSSATAKAMGIDIGERDSTHMSGRKGIYVNADYVLDALHAKAYGEVKSRNPDFDEEKLNTIAEAIAISAIRYNMVKQDLDKIITFDLKESMSLEGDTGPYLQYAYARSQRILEKSGQSVNNNASFELLTNESEIALIKEIAKLDLIIEDAARSLSPKSIARYAYSLATTFNLFYENVQVLREENADTKVARLALVSSFGISLKNALSLLGIAALERM